MNEEVLRIEHIVSVQSGVRVLDGCSLRVIKGEALGVFINNSYKRDGLKDILTGVDSFESGRVYLKDERLDQEEYSKAAKQRVACVGAQNRLIGDMTVAENIFVIRGGFKKYLLSESTLNDQASRLLRRFGLNIDPKSRTRNLTSAQRASVELIKAAATGAALVILDDLSRMLSAHEAEAFYDLADTFKSQGLAFLVIDSYLDVLIRRCDRLALLNAGRVMYTFRRGEMDEATIATMMDEAPRDITFPEARPSKAVLEFSDVYAGAIEGLSFRLNAGEIVSMLDMDGGATKDLLGLLSGAVRTEMGAVLLGDAEYAPRGLEGAIEQGVCVIPENPTERTLFRDMNAFSNLAFPSSNKVAGFWMVRRYRRSLYRSCVELLGEEIMAAPDIRSLNAEALQTLVYAKWLLFGPRVLILEKPFSATDPSLRRLTQRLLRMFAEKGCAVLALTTNRSEAQMVSGRVLVISKGRIWED